MTDEPRNGTTGRTKSEILAERLAHLESSPLLGALSEICDLGTCGGRGGLQRALDIASAAIEADLERWKRGKQAEGTGDEK